jgi:3-oxoacyl-[acyl-carrier-protein] synthase III
VEVRIMGTGSYAPENIVKNSDLAAIVDTTDEWIVTRTGIRERRISCGENTSHIATKAALKALEAAEVKPEEIDLIIVATLTPDMYTPAAACMVQKNLGASRASAFDLNAACSGFIYGLNVGAQFIKTGTYKKILVIGAEVLSKILNWKDRNTCVLFGDGAGAVVLGPSEEKGIISVHTGAEGDKGEVLECPALPIDNPYAVGKLNLVEGTEEQQLLKRPSHVTMDGREVFRFATGIMTDSIERLLKDSALQIEDISYIVPHQANLRIIDFASRKLNLDLSRFYINLDRYGNTSSASIPIALDEMNKKGMLKKGDKLIFVGFGGGLTYGAALIQWLC